MGTKAEKRAARTAAAQARDQALVERASGDPLLLDWLKKSRELDPRAFARAAAGARHHAARPSSPEHQRALVVLGGLQALEAEACPS